MADQTHRPIMLLCRGEIQASAYHPRGLVGLGLSCLVYLVAHWTDRFDGQTEQWESAFAPRELGSRLGGFVASREVGRN